MNTKDKAALIEMAELWDRHAEDAERQEKNQEKQMREVRRYEEI